MYFSREKDPTCSQIFINLKFLHKNSSPHTECLSISTLTDIFYYLKTIMNAASHHLNPYYTEFDEFLGLNHTQNVIGLNAAFCQHFP